MVKEMDKRIRSVKIFYLQCYQQFTYIKREVKTTYF
jgi:hypothetical protein